MLQQIQQTGQVDFGGGLNTSPNVFSLKPNQTPDCLNVRFDIGGTVEKRLGSTTLNAVVLVSSAATGFTPDTNSTLTTGLVSFWKLDETAGTRMDAYGGNPLVDNNTVGFAAGILANAASMSVTNTAYLSLVNNSSIQGGSSKSFTITSWVFSNGYQTDGATNTNAIVSKDSGGTTGREYSLYNNVSGTLNKFRFTVFDATGASAGDVTANSFGNAGTGSWIFVVAWLNTAAQTVNIQVNNGVIDSALLVGTPAVTSSPLFIGARPVIDSVWSGRIDETGWWQKVLSVQERTDLYNGGASNTYNPATSTSGFGAFDFGAAFANGQPLRWLTVAAGTGIYASSNRGVAFVVVATDRGANYQSFERSKSFLIATSDTGNKVLYWAGSVGTFMQALAPGSAPPAKYALSFQGFLFLMNHSGGNRSITYAGEPVITTDPWTSTFDLPSSFDDEITGGIILNKKAYVSTKYALYRVSSVGGNPDFAYQQVKQWGWVPGTQKKVVLPQVGEVIMCLSWDKKLRVFDGSEDFIISQDIEKSNGMNAFALSNILDASLNQCRAEVDTTEQVYKLLVAIAPSTQTTMMLNFNSRIGAFYPYDTQPFNALTMAESGNTRILVGVARNGFVHQLGTSNTDAGAAVDAYYRSPFLFGSTPRGVQKNQKITFYFSVTSSGTVYLQDRSDFNSKFGLPRGTITFTDTTTQVVVSKTLDVPLTQNVIQYQLTDSASKANPWRLLRTDHEFSILGIGKA